MEATQNKLPEDCKHSLPHNFLRIKPTQTRPMLEEIDSFLVDNYSEWDKITWRQEVFSGTHKNTKHIPLIFDRDFRPAHPTFCDNYDKVKNDLDNISNILSEFYGSGYIIRALLVKLTNNSGIPTHKDSGRSLTSCRRVHIPVITNEDVLFTVGDETINMKRGEMWEINNDGKDHSVSNNSDYDRVHLIVDWQVS